MRKLITARARKNNALKRSQRPFDTPIFCGVFFVSKSLWELRDKRTKKIHNFNLKASKPCQNIEISNFAYLLYMQNTGFKVWKPKSPVQHINSAAYTRIAFLN